MDKQTNKYYFTTNICGCAKTLCISVESTTSGLETGLYRPDSLRETISAMCPENRFIELSQMQTAVMNCIDDYESLLDVHIGALIGVIVDYMSHNPSMLFSELLYFVDSFAFLLRGDDFSEEKIKEMYPVITKSIVDLYKNRIAVPELLEQLFV